MSISEEHQAVKLATQAIKRSAHNIAARLPTSALITLAESEKRLLKMECDYQLARSEIMEDCANLITH